MLTDRWFSYSHYTILSQSKNISSSAHCSSSNGVLYTGCRTITQYTAQTTWRTFRSAVQRSALVRSAVCGGGAEILFTLQAQPTNRTQTTQKCPETSCSYISLNSWNVVKESRAFTLRDWLSLKRQFTYKKWSYVIYSHSCCCTHVFLLFCGT